MRAAKFGFIHQINNWTCADEVEFRFHIYPRVFLLFFSPGCVDKDAREIANVFYEIRRLRPGNITRTSNSASASVSAAAQLLCLSLSLSPSLFLQDIDMQFGSRRAKYGALVYLSEAIQCRYSLKGCISATLWGLFLGGIFFFCSSHHHHHHNHIQASLIS